MQEEINRIRNKDYSQIDQRLYSNMGMSSQLDTTLAQLAELQKYLKSQIDSIEDESKKEAAMRASKVVMGMNMQESSRVFQKYDCSRLLRPILERVRKISKSFKSIKEGIQLQVQSCIFDTIEMFNDALGFVTASSNRRQNENSKLKAQLYACQQELHDLKRKNEQMQQKLDDWEKAQQRRKQKSQAHFPKNLRSPNQDNLSTAREQVIMTLYEESSMATDREMQCKRNSQKQFKSMYPEIDQIQTECDVPRLPMPLRREGSLHKQERQENSVSKFMSCQNSRKQLLENSVNTRIQTGKNVSVIKVQSVGQSPTKKLRDKQNEILKLKGTQASSNRRSTKKLKLFSLI